MRETPDTKFMIHCNTRTMTKLNTEICFFYLKGIGIYVFNSVLINIFNNFIVYLLHVVTFTLGSFLLHIKTRLGGFLPEI